MSTDLRISEALLIAGLKIDPDKCRIKEHQNVITFFHPIVFLKNDEVFYASVEVDLDNKSSVSEITSNSGNDLGEIQFYHSSEERESVIEFVLNAINRSNEVGKVERSLFDDRMQIFDFPDHYSVTVISPYQESWYKVRKSNGELYDAGHAHFVIEPD